MIAETPKTMAELQAEARGENRGICCPKCKSRRMPAVKSEPVANGTQVRVRECRECGTKVQSREEILGVVKQRS